MQDSYYDDEYLETRVLTAPPHQLHLMVLEGAIRSARLAGVSLQEKDYERAHELLNRGREFVAELITGLNGDHMPDMVDSLRRLFTYVYRNLAIADLEHNLQPIEAAVRILEHHRQTWLELLAEMAGSPQAPPTEVDTPTDTVQCTDTFTWEG